MSIVIKNWDNLPDVCVVCPCYQYVANWKKAVCQASKPQIILDSIDEFQEKHPSCPLGRPADVLTEKDIKTWCIKHNCLIVTVDGSPYPFKEEETK